MKQRSTTARDLGVSAQPFGLPIDHVSAWMFNSYVIHAEAGAVVIDPGLPCVAERVSRWVQASSSPSDRIAHVACTHGHSDHVGGVRPLLAEHPEASAHLPAECRAYLAGERPREFATVPSLVKFLPVASEQPFDARALREFVSSPRRAGFGGGTGSFQLDFEPSEFLADGTPLPGAPAWEVIHVPGHTDDSTAFYHRASETLCSGDAVVVQDGRAWFNPEWVDLDASRSTEERLRALPVSHLLPGHGPPIEAANVWATARSSQSPPSGRGLLARCSRRFGRWDR